MKVASYCRVSTDKEDQVNSFEAQQRYFREYILHRPDWELFDIYADEGITGTSTKKRVHFNRMIADAYEGKFQLIITKEVSRFSRNVLDTISYTRELKAIGVGVLFVIDGINTLNPDAELYLAIMASIAQEESRKTSSRIVWGQMRQMERGVVFGRSMLGYNVKDGKISIEAEGAKIVSLIFQKYAVEQVATSQIARFLTEEGYRTYTGNTEWKSSTVAKILNNEKYVGDLVQKKTYTPDFLTHAKRRNHGEIPLIRIENHHEPIITRQVWNMAQKRLKRNRKSQKGGGAHSNRYMFSGRIKCGECGASFVGRFQYRKDGKKIRRWRCGTAAGEGAKSCSVGKLVRDDDVIHMICTSIGSLPIDFREIISNVATLALASIQTGKQETVSKLKDLQQEKKGIQKKKEAMMDSFFSGEITKEDMLAMKLRYDKQLEALKTKIAKAKTCQNKDDDPNHLKEVIQAEAYAILKMEVESEVFCKTVLHQLTVFKDRHMELSLNHLSHVFVFAE